MKEIILQSSQAKKIAKHGDLSEFLIFLKNIGSNFILKGKKFQFSSHSGWRALAEREPNTTWRREWDSNPRNPCELTDFPGLPVKPLLHSPIISCRIDQLSIFFLCSLLDASNTILFCKPQIGFRIPQHILVSTDQMAWSIWRRYCYVLPAFCAHQW